MAVTVAEYLASFLKAQGVSHVFGLPGGENVPVIEALRQMGVEYVLVHHEATAGFAADVTGQLTDRPGVCMSTVGPGAANLLATAAGATLERSPVLAITANIDASLQARISHMRLDLPALYGAACKGSFAITAETAAADVRQAWQLALTPPRGAVHLAISPETAAQPVPDASITSVHLPSPGFEPSRLEPAVPYLHQAQALFILAGLGLEAAAAQAQLLALAEAWQVPVAVTPKMKGHFPEDHPLYAGCFSAYGDGVLRRALDEVDLILGVGLDSVDFVTSTWPTDTPVVNLAPAAADDPAVRPLVAVNGNLGQMLAALPPLRAANPDGLALARDLRQAINRAILTPNRERQGTIKLQALTAALQETLPDDGTVTIDVGAFKLVFLQQWRAHRPKSLFVANGLSAMGYAVPGAMAIKLAQPVRPVVAVVGDGALMMYAGELATVSRLDLPLVVLVVVDEALALIRLKQIRQAVPIHGTEFGRVNYRALAQAFGLAYRLIDGRDQATHTLHEALRLDGPVLVEARIDKAEYDHFK
jgi:acetolactate synthase-1/2/3 large subunit